MLALTEKNAFVTGIANKNSIAWGIAQQLHKAGANIGVNYLPDEKGRFEKKVKQLVEPISPDIIVPCDVQDDALMTEMFEAIAKKWDKLDILVHCLAFADKEYLEGDFSVVPRDAFSKSLEISAYSLVHFARLAKPLMKEGGSIITLSYIGGVKVMPSYNLMGIAKSALEMNVRYLAAELGEKNGSEAKRIFIEPNASHAGGEGVGSLCYIEDYSGEELLQSVSRMMEPVFRVAVDHLKPGGRLVYLLPLFPSQVDMGLWGTTGALGPDAFALLPNFPGLDFVAAERQRCRRRGMARAIVVMERTSTMARSGTCVT